MQQDQKQLDRDEIKIDKDEDGDPIELGKGSAGTVFQGLYSSLIPVAVKKMDVGGMAMTAAQKELKMFCYLTHPKVIKFFGYYIKKNSIYLVIELGTCSLQQLLESQIAGRLDFGKALIFALHIAEAIMFLHGQDIIHLDIKSSNVIICDGIAKITDLGTARKMMTTTTQSTLGRTGRGR